MNSAYKLKVLFSTLGLALLAAAPFAQAQDAAPSAASAAAPSDSTPPPPPPRAKKGMGDPLSAVTGLTDDQKAQIKSIQEATRAKIEALPDDDNKRGAIRAARMDASKQVRAILTDDQKAQYDAAMKKMMRKKKAPPADDSGSTPPPPPPPSGGN